MERTADCSLELADTGEATFHSSPAPGPRRRSQEQSTSQPAGDAIGNNEEEPTETRLVRQTLVNNDQNSQGGWPDGVPTPNLVTMPFDRRRRASRLRETRRPLPPKLTNAELRTTFRAINGIGAASQRLRRLSKPTEGSSSWIDRLSKKFSRSRDSTLSIPDMQDLPLRQPVAKRRPGALFEPSRSYLEELRGRNGAFDDVEENEYRVALNAYKRVESSQFLHNTILRRMSDPTDEEWRYLRTKCAAGMIKFGPPLTAALIEDEDKRNDTKTMRLANPQQPLYAPRPVAIVKPSPTTYEEERDAQECPYAAKVRVARAGRLFTRNERLEEKERKEAEEARERELSNGTEDTQLVVGHISAAEGGVEDEAPQQMPRGSYVFLEEAAKPGRVEEEAKIARKSSKRHAVRRRRSVRFELQPRDESHEKWTL